MTAPSLADLQALDAADPLATAQAAFMLSANASVPSLALPPTEAGV